MTACLDRAKSLGDPWPNKIAAYTKPPPSASYIQTDRNINKQRDMTNFADSPTRQYDKGNTETPLVPPHPCVPTPLVSYRTSASLVVWISAPPHGLFVAASSSLGHCPSGQHLNIKLKIPPGYRRPAPPWAGRDLGKWGTRLLRSQNSLRM